MPWTIIIIAGAVLLIAVWFVSTMNSLIKSKTTVEEAFSGMDIYLKKRYDLIPNLVETVKGYAAHEKETLENVIAARNSAVSVDRTDINGVEAAEKNLQGAIGRLLAIAEAYPDLKADSQFLNLQNQLQSIENDIAQSRKYYSGAAKLYNQKILMFPSSIVASLTGHKKVAYFEVSDAAQRENVQVSFK